jgi:hypothetical protein
MTIEPTVGRCLHYRPAAGNEPLAAMLAKVNSDTSVNLTVFGADGVTHARSNVPLVQEGEVPPEGQSYCEWMPYQTGQAKRTEEVERENAALRGMPVEDRPGAPKMAHADPKEDAAANRENERRQGRTR